MSTLKTNNIEHVDASTPSVQMSVGGGVVFPGISTFTGDATFSAGVSIGGTLTYEDVTSIDSVGIITAQAGIRVTGGKVGINQTSPASPLSFNTGTGQKIELYNSGSNNEFGFGLESSELRICAGAGSFMGFRTGGYSGTERLRITSGGGVLIGGHTTAVDGGNAPNIEIVNTSTSTLTLARNDTSISNGNDIAAIRVWGNDSNGTYQQCAEILAEADGDHGTDDKPTALSFKVTADGASSPTERLRITSAGDMGLGVTDATILDDSGFRELMIGGATEGAAIHLQDADGNVKFGAFTSDVSNAAFIRTVTNHPIVIRTNNQERLRITTNTESEVELYSGSTDGNYAVVRGKYSSSNEFNRSEIRFGVEANATGSGFLALATGTNSTTERIRITAAGRVGINVTAPEDTLHVKNTSNAATTIRIQTGEASNDIADGDEYASIIFDGSSYTGAKIGSNRDDGTWNDRGDLRFYSGYGNNVFTERMRIRNAGQVHIGDDLGVNHSGEFQVINTAGGQQTNDCLTYFETNANDWIMKFNCNEGGSAAHYHMYFMEEGATRGSISGSHGGNVNYNQGSDYRLKENIVDMTGTEGIDICKKLKPRKYNWIKNREGTGQINTVDGFLAHEVVEAGVLGAVVGEKDAVKDGKIDPQMLDYGQMTPVLAAAIKGLIDKVETLETKVAALEGS